MCWTPPYTRHKTNKTKNTTLYVLNTAIHKTQTTTNKTNNTTLYVLDTTIHKTQDEDNQYKNKAKHKISIRVTVEKLILVDKTSEI